MLFLNMAMKLEELKNKKILILGFGREGKDTFLFLRKLFPRKIIGIADLNPVLSKPALSRSHSGKNYLRAIRKYDIVIKTPGIPFKALPKSALRKITTQTEIFFDNCKGTIVGITGTKGKSTTSSMIHDVLKAGKIKAYLVGNIGKPALSFLPKAKKEDVFVYELSSHQLYNLKKSPQVAVFLNVFREHLDYYRSFRDYIMAKAQITLHQKKEDWLVYNSKDPIVKDIAGKSRAKKIPVSGKYYELDKAAARAVGKIFRIPPSVVSKTIRNFKRLPHRLELVGTYKGITFYNDALSTIPEATIGAMEFLGSRVETLMLGGFERNIDYENLAKEVLKRKIKTVILFPTTGERIWKEILKASRGRGLPDNFFAETMEEAVRLAYLCTGKGGICLLSTASPSFSIFKDYKEKGNLFKKQVFLQGKGKRRWK